MARLELTLPAQLPFATELDVRVTDMNYGGHLGNDAMLSLIHEARFRFFRHHGMSERDAGGARLVLADVAIVYRKEAFAGDRLRFEVGIGDTARVACDLCYRVTRPADAQLVAEAKTGLVFLDPETRRPIAVPPRVMALRAEPS
ncbi:MAG: acyl-CoA thioesterase [Planctomycetota bacterium]